MKTQYEVIVVGSGAGGASVAYELAKKGKSVLIIESGSFVKDSHEGNFWKSVVFNGYYYRLAAFSRSKEGTIIYHTKNVGGTTVFACGNMVRSCQRDFLNHEIDLEKSFHEAEIDLGVEPVPEKKIILGTKAIMQSANQLGYNMTPMPKGLSDNGICDLCGDCVLGCVRKAKWDARSYVDKAIDFGAEIMSSTKVEKVLFSGTDVKGVKIAGFLGREIFASKVILCAGGLNTPVILQNSGVDAGNSMFLDPFNTTYGISDDLTQVKGASMGAVTTEFHESEGFILSPYIDHWSQQMLFCPPWWNVANYFPQKRVIGIMTKITDEMIGTVRPSGFSKELTEQDCSRLNAGARIAKEILLDAGARDIVTTQHARGAHPGGTVAVGEALDNTLQVKGSKGLHVCDASVFPVTPGLPPILTIVALGKWLGKKI